MADPWPSLPLEDWKDTYATLHRWTQIVGNIRLAQSPWINHSWHVTLYVTARGLTTSPIPYGTRTFQLDFDFIDHGLLIQTGEGAVRTIALRALARRWTGALPGVLFVCVPHAGRVRCGTGSSGQCLLQPRPGGVRPALRRGAAGALARRGTPRVPPEHVRGGGRARALGPRSARVPALTPSRPLCWRPMPEDVAGLPGG